ncbi:MAG: YhcN/YlaJ family sporulation lipoprotein [Clostridia bacterium]|nr:YhcN/YlaJ family sporulation lipoprotein [Clostridia bacterium]
MKKSLMILLCIAMAGVVLNGCASRRASGTTATAAPIVTNSPMATSSPMATVSPDMSPETSMGPGMQANNAGGMTATTDTMDNGMMPGQSGNTSGMTPAQADRLAEQVEEAVERISEIDDTEAVIDSDNRVVIAVEFDDQYNAGLDDRMKEMITEAVQKVDEKLTDVQITDDSTLYGQVKSLGDRLTKATGLDELADDFGDLWNRITGM